MKRLMAFLMILMLVMPFAGVNAENADSDWHVYGPGEEVNFYMYEGDDVGVTTIILSDEGSTAQYAKVLVTGFSTNSSDSYADTVLGESATPFEKTGAYKTLLSAINDRAQGFPYALDLANNLHLITLDELKTVFGATLEEDVYKIDVEKYGKAFEAYHGSKEGFFTETVEGDEVWVVKFTYDGEHNITDITVEKEPITSNAYDLVPVVYFDKTYDCTERESGNEEDKDYACYSCDNDYTWTVVGEQADNCTLVETINAKADCVKNPETGLEDYIVEFLVIAGICVGALIIVKRKELFRGV